MLILLFITAAVVENRSPFGINTEYYQLIGGLFELQFKSWTPSPKNLSEGKLPDSKFELEYTAKEAGFNLDRIHNGNLGNLKQIPHGVVWSGYMIVTNPAEYVVNIEYSGLIVVLLNEKLTYTNISETKNEKISFGLDKELIPFKIAFYTDNGAGDFKLSLSGQEPVKYYLTTEKVAANDVNKIDLFFKIIEAIKIASLILIFCIAAYSILSRLYRAIKKEKKMPLLTKVFLTSFIVYFFMSVLIQKSFLHLTGDEPHYLLVAHSIFYDHDIDLYNNYRYREYSRFFPLVFVYPHIKETSKIKMASSHGIMLPLLLAPAYGLMGKAGAIFMMTIIMSIIVMLLARLLEVYKLTSKRNLFIMFTVFFAPPLSYYSFSLYPEPFALMAILLYLNFFQRPDLKGKSYLLYILMLICLPHFHYKFFVIVFLFYIFRQKKLFQKGWFFNFFMEFAVPILSFLMVYGILMGEPAFYFNVLPKGMFSITTFLTSSWGLLLEREYGLFPWAFYLVFMIFSLPYLYKKRHINPNFVVLLFLGITGISAFFSNWNDGSPKGRFFVLILPLLILSLTYVLDNKKAFWLYLIFWLHSLLFSLYYLIYNPDYIYGYEKYDTVPPVVLFWRQLFPSIYNTLPQVLIYIIFWLSILTIIYFFIKKTCLKAGKKISMICY